MILRHIGNFDQFNIEDQIRFRGDPWMVRATIWNRMRSVSQLERDEETPLAAYLHATEALVKAGEWPSPAHAPALQKLEWLRFAQFWLAVGIFLGLPILIQHRRPMIVRRVELYSISRSPSCVVHLIELAGLCLGAGSDLDVLEAKRKCGFGNATSGRHSRRQLDAGRGRGWPGCGRWLCRGCGLGCGLSKCGTRREEKDQDELFHCVLLLRGCSHRECNRHSAMRESTRPRNLLAQIRKAL
jgi:hypothetical protein